MGNTWNYEIVFQESQLSTPNRLKQILAIANHHGYVLRYPTYVFSANGRDDLHFFDSETVAAYAGSNGGSFAVWRDDYDILFSYSPQWERFSFGVQYNLRSGRDTEIARDLENVFSTMCQVFQPLFGFSHDEWGNEWALKLAFPGSDYFTAWKKTQESIAQKAAPLLLFWLNYFDRSYFESIGEWRFKDLGLHKIVPTEHGVFLYLAGASWDLELAQLGADGKYRLIKSA